jgi:nucleoredoxin
MRNVFLILLLEAIVLGCAGAFLYQKDPAGSIRVVDDLQQLVNSAISGSHSSPAVPVVAPAPVAPPAPPKALYAPSPPPTPALATPAPPAAMPAQPNWTWITIAGLVYTNVKVLSFDHDSVMITYDGGGERVPLSYLPPDLRKLFTTSPSGTNAPAASPGPPAGAGAGANTPPAASSVLGHLLSGNLVRSTNNGLQPVDDAPVAAARYIAIYYSAQWCPPCHAFTPKLVQFYNSFKPAHPDFDLVFVSEDRDENQMHDYMQEMAMPWPAIRYDQLQHPPGTFKGTGIEGFANNGIPDLVLLDSTGKVLSDSYHGTEYVGPEAVVADIQSMVK